AVRDVEMEAEAHALAELDVDAETLMRLLPFQDDAVHRAALCRAAADQALNAVLRHEIERPFAAALNRLPAFDRKPPRPRHQRQLLELGPAIRHLRRQGVGLALVREALAVEGLEDDVDVHID